MGKAKFLLVIFLSFSHVLLFSQSVESLQKDFPDHEAVITKRSHTLSLEIFEGTINTTISVLERKRILKKLNKYDYHVENIYYNSLQKISKIKSHIKNPWDLATGEEGILADVETIFSEGELESDFKRQKIYFKGAKAGRQIQVQYEKTIINPYLIPIFHFDQEYPATKTIFQITAAKDIEIGYFTFNLDSIDINFTKSELDGKINYTWEANNVFPVETETHGPGIFALSPMIIPYVKSFNYNGKTSYLLDTPKELHKWYIKMIGSNQEDYGLRNIHDLSKKITDTISNEQDKIKAIFQWVQTNIKYLSTDEEGLGGFVPKHAEKVLKNRYGDCKAMTNLTYRLLEAAGIKSYFAWVGTNDLPFNYQNNPTPSTDNHMILAFEKADGEYQLLDATNSYGSFYDVPYFIQGKETLISLNDSSFTIKKIPVDDFQKNVLFDSIYLYEDDGLLKAHSNLIITGSQKYRSESGFPLVHNEIVDYIKEHYIMANKKTRLNNISYSGIKDRTNRMEISYDYELFHHSFHTKSKKYINMNLDKPLVRFDIDIEKRKTDYIFDFPSAYHYLCFYKIPDGYELDHMPASKTYDHDKFVMELNYTKSKGGIKLSRILSIKDKTILTSDFVHWNEFIGLLSDAYTELVVLKQIK